MAEAGPRVGDIVTADDLIGVEMLSVQVPPRVALDFLQGELGREINDELRHIPIDIDLGDDRAVAYIRDGGPADRAWHLLKEREGVGWVTAGKLLARKGPRLLPVYDEVVTCAFSTGKGFCVWLHEQLRADDFALTRRLNHLREAAGISPAISAIRILDVVFWMRHRDEHMGDRCPGLNVPPDGR